MKVLDSIANNSKNIISISIFLMAVMSVLSTNFSKPLFGDEFYYLLKAFEMKYGNWEVFKSDAFGLPVLLYVLMKLLSIDSLLGGMLLSRILTIFFTVLSIIPLWLLSKKMLPKPLYVLPIVFYVFSSVLILHSGSGMTEPIFVFITLSSLLFLSDESTLKHFLAASFLAALSYYIRFNGSFLIATIVFYQLYLSFKGKSKWYYSILIIGVYVACLLPDFYLRYITHGTIFDYGANSKYFIDNYNKVWFKNTESPSLFQFLSESSVYEIYRKFILTGLFKVNSYIFDSLSIVIYVFFSAGLFLLLKFKKFKIFIPIILFFVINIAALCFVFDIYHSHRHIYILLPIIFLVSAYPFHFIYNWKYGKIISFGLIAIIVISNLYNTTSKINSANFSLPKEKQWAVWVSKNTSGNIFMYGGSENIRTVFFVKDITTARNQVYFSKHWNFWLRKPIYTENIADLYKYISGFSPRYLVLLKPDFEFYPMLNELHTDKWKDKFQLIKTFSDDELNVELYKVN
ncbi:MAG TPA: hypothetical protein DDX39_10035 [Bacteroidales bacterium]|nr:MAG: hypothetical protein A2W98_01340 [Bacteroidetes bacterium GWF2_33_38]OFY75181.1 MAG: hypothetical protein A2265_05200 [Bacteroidetes bacterium RIFOXYA12_FULL_33_9]OFY88975.1 MAG: hypothetical protein A2236_04285 [Bacteroidetes bacterium RIFOXYA2_FULL_33_7]HBF88969.1 hypothetical protein [Bacteroidales bacterium]